VTHRRKTESRRAIEFAAILALIGLAFAAVALWRHHALRAAVFAAAGLAALALAVLVRPAWLVLFRLWMALGEGLGWVMTRVILTVFYFAVLTPIGLLRRLAGKPTLNTAWRDGKPSYWVDKESVEPSIERYTKRY
jgi:hypothetical protein